MARAFITGCAGPVLSANEVAFMRAAQPAGLILFQRNCLGPDQVRRLIASFREAVGGADALVLVDQEGGRVQRLRAPAWRELPAAALFGKLYEHDQRVGLTAAKVVAQLVASELAADGFNMNCVPVLDVPGAGAHEIIGDRAFCSDPAAIVALGEAVAIGHLSQGVLPVMKHVPGHGRAMADSHEELPVVDAPLEELANVDFIPFQALRNMPAAMTAHVLYRNLDPDQPASTSHAIIAEVVRRYMGFEGLLMSDDLSMKALEGSVAERARAVIAAGCDLALHCNGQLGEMEAVASNVPVLGGAAAVRFEACIALTGRREAFDREGAVAIVREMLGGGGWHAAVG
ncbi:MAG: beta-N-acetylhexosaminidase [Rhizobiales bacterium]|nr:beta-N-acetylhexosaminidase [Hyphomicrobiales bacterium]